MIKPIGARWVGDFFFAVSIRNSFYFASATKHTATHHTESNTATDRTVQGSLECVWAQATACGRWTLHCDSRLALLQSLDPMYGVWSLAVFAQWLNGKQANSHNAILNNSVSNLWLLAVVYYFVFFFFFYCHYCLCNSLVIHFVCWSDDRRRRKTKKKKHV